MALFAKDRIGQSLGLMAAGGVLGAAIAAISVLAVFSNLNNSNGLQSDIGQATGTSEVAFSSSSEPKAGSSGSAQINYDIANYRDNFEGNLALHAMLQQANKQETLGYFEQTKRIESNNRRHAAERAIVQRLAAMSPKEALTKIEGMSASRHGELVAVVFEEWSQSNLDEAVAHAKSLTDSNRQAAVRGMLDARDDLSEDLRIQIAKQLGNEKLAIDQRDQSTVLNFNEDPGKAFDALVTDNQADVSQLGAFLTVAKAMVDKEGLKALDTIRDSLGFSVVGNAVFLSAMHDSVQSDPHAAFQVASTLSSNNRRVALGAVVNSWVSSDPMAALAAVNTLEAGRLRKGLQETLVSAWAHRDPQDLFDHIESLPENLQDEAEQQAMLAIARTAPIEAVHFLAGLTDDERRMELARAIARNWSETDSYAALEWALSEQYSNERSRHAILSIVLTKLALEDPELALQSALNEPPGRFGRGLEVDVIQTVARFDLDQAIAMLEQVRDGPSKHSAYAHVGRALVSKGEYDRAIRLGQKLSDVGRAAYYSTVISQWAFAEPEYLFDSLDRLPSEELKTQAAMNLLLANNRTDALSPEQVEGLSDYVGDGENMLTQIRHLSPGRVVMFDGAAESLSGSVGIENEISEVIEVRLQQTLETLEQTLSDAMTDMAIEGAFVGDAVINTKAIEVKKEDDEEEEE